MKAARVSTYVQNLTAALVGIGAVVANLTGCIVVDNGGYQQPFNSSPYIQDVDVFCSWDSYYADYRWDFYAFVDDSDGYEDVRNTWVEVFDGSGYLERWDLAYDRGGQWSNTVYEYYSDYLNCDYYDLYEFDFRANDAYGAEDSVTFIP